jgi:hypothetical protein
MSTFVDRMEKDSCSAWWFIQDADKIKFENKQAFLSYWQLVIVLKTHLQPHTYCKRALNRV